MRTYASNRAEAEGKILSVVREQMDTYEAAVAADSRFSVKFGGFLTVDVILTPTPGEKIIENLLDYPFRFESIAQMKNAANTDGVDAVMLPTCLWGKYNLIRCKDDAVEPLEGEIVNRLMPLLFLHDSKIFSRDQLVNAAWYGKMSDHYATGIKVEAKHSNPIAAIRKAGESIGLYTITEWLPLKMYQPAATAESCVVRLCLLPCVASFLQDWLVQAA
jgi:hypothetical protein